MAGASQLHPFTRLSSQPLFKKSSAAPHFDHLTAVVFRGRYDRFSKLIKVSGGRKLSLKAKGATEGNAGAEVSDTEDGVSLGTMKLPNDVDIPRFEMLLFQWANSLCQGANLPLPVPLKVDRVQGGARLGFITMEDGGRTDVSVYIDCLVFPATAGSRPMFRAVRKGRLREQPPAGEPRIMRSLLQALQKSVEIAKL